VWRSWLAYLHGVQVVVRSSRITPTNDKGQNILPFLSTDMYVTYILYSSKLKKFYVGQTEDLYRRLEEHNRGKTPFLATGIPWILVFSMELSSRSQAMRLEKLIKKRGAARYLTDNQITVD
jgi:putative endonuclease